MTLQLNKAPSFSLVRSVAGLIAPDNPVINFTNYPKSSSFDPYGSKEIQLYWAATVTEAALDRLTIELLELSAEAGTERWIQGARVATIPPATITVFPVYANSVVFARVVAATITTSTNLRIWAAMAKVPGSG